MMNEKAVEKRAEVTLHSARLVWATPDMDGVLGYIARVSNPDNQENKNVERLFAYMEREGHVSPFEMGNICVEINTTRAIGRQILRHRSFSFQEFSQRYADVGSLQASEVSECRMQDTKNRQSSQEIGEESDNAVWWKAAQEELAGKVQTTYEEALRRGMAKEVSRNVLMEGNTPSRLYMNGTLRSYIHYLRSRLHPSTQKEHRLVAIDIAEVFKAAAPVVFAAFFGDFDFVAARRNPQYIGPGFVEAPVPAAVPKPTMPEPRDQHWPFPRVTGKRP